MDGIVLCSVLKFTGGNHKQLVIEMLFVHFQTLARKILNSNSD